MANILTTLQNSFLDKFFQQTQEFYLTGGTALSAFYLQHRYSEDVDLFTQQSLAFQMADNLANQICSKLKVACIPVRITSSFKNFAIGSKDTSLTVHF
jgi:predicted nucleotidyltransferase component of viral defense system